MENELQSLLTRHKSFFTKRAPRDPEESRSNGTRLDSERGIEPEATSQMHGRIGEANTQSPSSRPSSYEVKNADADRGQDKESVRQAEQDAIPTGETHTGHAKEPSERHTVSDRDAGTGTVLEGGQRATKYRV